MATMKKELIKARLKVNHEPVINVMDYTISMMNALNYYNANHDGSDYRKWFVEHFKKQIDFPLTVINDFEFRVGGVLARIIANGNIIEDQHIMRLDSEFKRVQALCKAAKQPVVVVASGVKKPTIQERMDDKVSDFIGEFNGLVDEYANTRELPNVGALLKTMNIAGPMGKKIADKVAKPIAELREALDGADKQLVEGYSQFKKAELKKLIGIYDTLLEKLVQAKVTAPKKTRAVKVKPAGVVVAKLKYKKDDIELKLASVAPTLIIGASEVWTYNTKTKKLQSYFATEGTGITVKGTTLLNWNTEKSKQRTIRKPDILTSLVGGGKRMYGQFLKSLTTKDVDVNGRFSEDTIIMAAFK